MLTTGSSELASAEESERLYLDAQRLPAALFEKRYPFRFLVPAFAEEAPASEPDVARWGDAPTGIVECGDGATLGHRIFALRKTQPLYESMITVGRTHNHDVVLRDPSVSKFHAYFKLFGSRVYLIDAGSTYGTTVSEKRLLGREPLLVPDGAIVGFGHVRLRLVPASLVFSALPAAHLAARGA